MAVTSDGTPYVEPGDAISAYPTVSQELAAVIDSLRRLIPVGTIAPYAGALTTGAPEGWLTCDGKAYARADFPDLYTIMSDWLGEWGGFPSGNSARFYVPDMRGRAPFGVGGGGVAHIHPLGHRGGDKRMQFHTHNVLYRDDGNLMTFFGNVLQDDPAPSPPHRLAVNRDYDYDSDAVNQPLNSMVAREPRVTPSGDGLLETNPTTSMPPFTGTSFIVYTGTITTGKNSTGEQLPEVTTRMMIEARLEEAGIGEEEIEMLREQLAALKEDTDG